MRELDEASKLIDTVTSMGGKRIMEARLLQCECEEDSQKINPKSASTPVYFYNIILVFNEVMKVTKALNYQKSVMVINMYY